MSDLVESHSRPTGNSSRQLADVPAEATVLPHEEVPPTIAVEPVRPATASTDLESKYAGKDLGDLMLALQQVMAVHGEQRNRLIDERWERGLYDEQFVPDGAPNLPAPRAADGSFPSYGFKTEPAVGGTILKMTILDPAEYPEFGALEHELKWLRARTGGFPPPLAVK